MRRGGGGASGGGATFGQEGFVGESLCTLKQWWVWVVVGGGSER